MSVQDEREFRERLGGLLDGIEPAPAPVLRAMRQGRGIRMRRWISAAAGVAVLAGVAAALPFLLHQQGRIAPMAKPHYSVTVNQPGPHRRPGLIASGTENHRNWSVVITGHGQNSMISGGGLTNGFGPVSPLAGSAVQITQGWGGTDGAYSFVGNLGPDVTNVAVVMNNGETLNLVPVPYNGLRLIALTIPRGARILRAEAFHNATELRYSIPYTAADLVNWWLPGQATPARTTKTIGSGVFKGQTWKVQAQFGPWGYCFVLPVGNSTCADGLSPYQIPAGHVETEMSCQPSDPGGPQFNLSAVRPDIRRVIVSFHGQPSATYRPVEVAGMHFVLILFRQHARIASAIAYNAAGQRLGAFTDVTCP